jgi:hypothetical protein
MKPDRVSEPFTAECQMVMAGRMAGRQGFEPRYRGPEPRVLPLDDLPVSVAALPSARTCDYIQSNLERTSAATDTGTPGRQDLPSAREVVPDRRISRRLVVSIGRFFTRLLLLLLAAVAGHAALPPGFARFFAGPLVRGALLMCSLAALTRDLSLLISVH